MPFEDPTLANFGGSLAAGVACGYLSHIPHNLSTLKLLQPSLSYSQACASAIDPLPMAESRPWLSLDHG